MARYTGPVCRLCRREGMKLFLKGERCYTKCILDKRPTPPGQHGKQRVKVSDYGRHLREKQKARWISGVLENQFQRYFHNAEAEKGMTGENLLRALELRLDNVVRRMGFASSTKAARQMVLHGHVQVNGKTVNVSSYGVKAGDAIALKEKIKTNVFVKGTLENTAKRGGVPSWLEVSPDTFSGKVLHVPSREEMSYPINEQLIVELYSK